MDAAIDEDGAARDGAIAAYYARAGLEDAIRAGLARLEGAEGSAAEKLGAVDEFHMGGRPATQALAEAMGLAPGALVLDVGCGIGGTARHLAAACGARVEGVDLTPDFIAVGQALTAELGMADRVHLQIANATALPFAPESFDAAVMLHVGMNIPDKAGVFAGVARALKPGGIFAVYDVMRGGPGELSFPVPWAGNPQVSFLTSPAGYRTALKAAGFTVEGEENRAEMALAMFRKMRARMAEAGPPPLGLHLLMGPDAPVKLANMIAALEAGLVAPVQIIARKG
ncbi:class I SAM-dependent methyltransferase [Solirhodobacter olei]|uniref:class I SAM-dependent methyltransferase n=1 Tax=Solirhodobacter olei TaxID=2493082 RepID=UPI000FD9EFA8|nr:class I SAM-dependent methyltransferase [Solirhodobacter olei]